ncbi:MAG: SDR family NAD(P)-dependent oxidoreductase, partial [Bryobacterales bacterium]|nr:SDR family NAD(P)-dependent oxidoreductase [Bryobacterales bacterium]
MTSLNDKCVLITGAKGELGTAVTRAFLATGSRVAGVSRSIANSDFPHAQFLAVPADIGSVEGARSAVNTALAAFGSLDGVIHLVGGFASGAMADETGSDEV